MVKIDGGGNKVWDKSFGGALNDEITSIVATGDGYILGGKSNSNSILSGSGPGVKKAGLKGNNDFWVVKIKANGDYVDDFSFGGNNDDGISSMTATADGGFVLGGYSNSDNTGARYNTNGKKDFWVVKINAAGGKEWDRSFGGQDDDVMNSIIATSDGGFILGGESKSLPGGTGPEAKTANYYGNADFWVVKINANGGYVSDYSFGGNSEDGIKSMTATSDGGFVLGVESKTLPGGSGPGAKKADFYGNADYWVVKIDGKGEYVWDKSFGGDQDDVIKSVVRAQAPDGGFVLGGFTASPPNPTKNKSAATYGSRDFWVVKINASGDRVWDTSFGGSGIDEITSVVATTTPDKSFILGGFSASPVGGLPGRTLPLGTGGSDFWLVKIK